jgi:methylated-DNA-[protein]-cysteine S-methyltransferase
MIELFSDRVESPIGTILIISDGTRLHSLDYRGYDHRMDRLLVQRYGEYTLRDLADPGGATSAMRAYLGGDLNAIAICPSRSAARRFRSASGPNCAASRRAPRSPTASKRNAWA